MPRGRPAKTLTSAELLKRHRNKTLVWCDEDGNPVADQTAPTGYIRPLTKAEERSFDPWPNRGPIAPAAPGA